MKLINGTLRPGVVLEVLENGKIKASAPGLFRAKDKDLNPPIMPFNELIGSHQNTFSTPKIGEEIWVLNVSDNPLQLYWFRKDDHIKNNQEIFQETGVENVEILCNTESKLGYASLFFSDGSGWVLKNDESRIQIHPNGDIKIDNGTPYRNILINADSIQLGSNEHPAAYGDELTEILIKICGILSATAEIAKCNPYTSTLSVPLSLAQQVANEVPGIVSSHVKLA